MHVEELGGNLKFPNAVGGKAPVGVFKVYTIKSSNGTSSLTTIEPMRTKVNHLDFCRF